MRVSRLLLLVVVFAGVLLAVVDVVGHQDAADAARPALLRVFAEPATEAAERPLIVAQAAAGCHFGLGCLGVLKTAPILVLAIVLWLFAVSATGRTSVGLFAPVGGRAPPWFGLRVSQLSVLLT